MSDRCANCGEPDRGTAFCGTCGAPAGSVVAHLDPVIDVEVASERSATSRLLVALVAIVALGGLGLLLLGGGSDDDPAATSPTTSVAPAGGDAAAAPITQAEDPDAVPLLDAPLDAYVLTLSRDTLRRTDLDSGEALEMGIASTPGRSMWRFGDDVALVHHDLGELTEIVVDPLGLDRVVLTSRRAVISSASDEGLVIADQNREDRTRQWSVLPSFDGEPQPVDFPDSFGAQSIAGVIGDDVVLNGPLGGLRWNGATVVEHYDGVVLASRGDRGLWYSCDDGLSCRLFTGRLGTHGDLIVEAAGLFDPFARLEVQVVGDTVVLLGESLVEPVLGLLVVDLASGAHQEHTIARTGGLEPGIWAPLPDGSGVVGSQVVFFFDCACFFRHAADLTGSVGLEGPGFVVVPKG